MKLSSDYNGRTIIQCAVCKGTGRLYPFSFRQDITSNLLSSSMHAGIDCPNCSGLGKNEACGSMSRCDQY